MNIFEKILEWIKNLFKFNKKSKPSNSPHCSRSFNNSYMKKGKVHAWQIREREVCKENYIPNLSVELSFDKLQYIENVIKAVRKHVKYVSDQENWGVSEHWATSKEIFNKLSGDCDDQGMMMWKLLDVSGLFKQDEIGLVHISGHMFCCYHHTENDFYILDNGFVTKKTLALASDIFPIERNGSFLYPLYGFNLYNSWQYTS